MTDETRNYRLCISASVDNDRYTRIPGRRAKLAPAAYAVYSPDLPDASMLWGQGYASDSQAYFAHGIADALDEIMLAGVEDFSLTVCLTNPGMRAFIEQYAGQWVANEDKNSVGGTPNNIEVWKRVYVLSSLGQIDFRKPRDAAERNFLKRAQDVAKSRSKKMPDCGPKAVDGITDTGRGE